MSTPRAGGLAALSAVSLLSSLALAGVAGTAHDFRGSAQYPHLAAEADRNVCAACHPAAALYGSQGNDFDGGVPLVTDPTYGRVIPSLPGAMACLACHDGVIRTPTGVDLMPAPQPGMNGPDLDESHGGAHNIWGMGNDSAYHPVEIHYPPLESEKIWPGFTTLPIAGDHNVEQDAAGRFWIYDLGTTVKLPLVTDPADPTRGIVSCVTCHDPHDDSADYAFKRLGWPDLCFMCHRRMN